MLGIIRKNNGRKIKKNILLSFTHHDTQNTFWVNFISENCP